MEFLELAKSRYSVRSFSSRQIEKEKLDKILLAGNVAPTAKNNQPQKIYVLQSKEALQKINDVCGCIFGASTVMLIAANKDEMWKNPFYYTYNTADVDASIVCTHMMLQAWELGIGSCWVGLFDEQKVKRQMNLPDNEKSLRFCRSVIRRQNPNPRRVMKSAKICRKRLNICDF